jgi:uncharacterized membrane protein
VSVAFVDAWRHQNQAKQRLKFVLLRVVVATSVLAPLVYFVPRTVLLDIINRPLDLLGRMTLVPLLEASPVIQVHAFVAFSAFVLGLLQFVAPKGTIPHRAVGWTWFVLMVTMLVSAFFMRHGMPWSPFSPGVCTVAGQSEKWMLRCAGTHLLAVELLLMIPYAVLYARHNEINNHRRAMLGIMLVALVISGLFTLDVGRIMNKVVFGL